MRIVVFDTQAPFYAAQLATKTVDVVPVLTHNDALAEIGNADVLIVPDHRVTPELIAAARNLKWVHALGCDVDRLSSYDGFVVTHSRGIHGTQMSELIVMLMLAMLRNFVRMQTNQRMAVWDRWAQPVLADKSVCIIGVGAIAERLAHVLAGFDMQITGVTRRTAVDGFDHLYPRSRIHAAVSKADFVVVLTPNTRENHHIIDETVIAAMKSSGFLINVSHGGCLDETALVRALNGGQIAGAALDVFQTEPVSNDNLLWAVPNLIITPHLGGFSENYHHQALPIIAANLHAFQSGGAAALTGCINRTKSNT